MRLRHLLPVAAGFLFLALGALGVALPILPTTPFVLLAGGCFASTPRLQAWMMKIPFFNQYLRNYREGCRLPRRTVIQSLVFLWGMLLISAFHMRAPWMAALLAAVGICVTVHILWIARGRKGKCHE